METLHYETSRELPLRHEADVIVVGGGPGGLGAAVMAARCGARTLLVERYGFLGGMAAAGEVHPFMANHVDDQPLDTPVYTDWVRRMHALWPREGKDGHIFKEAAMLAAEELCLEAGTELLYHHQLADVVVAGGGVKHLVLLSKSGLTAAKAKVYIDCTGDADLAALAGCEFEQGGPTGHCQPMTLCFKLSNVDTDRAADRAEFTRLFDEAKARGEMTNPRHDVLAFEWLEHGVVHFNTTRVIHKSGTDGGELSQAEIEGHKQLREFLAFCQKHVPGYEHARLYSMAHHIGVRETRRVRGMAYLTRKAFETRAKFPDAIARVRYPIDIHSPDGGGTEIVHIPEGDWYEIPYGCIVARDVDNLLVAGRPISVDHAIHSSMRVMPPCCTIGQAAGLAAALAAERACGPKDLDGTEVRQKLIDMGARL